MTPMRRLAKSIFSLALTLLWAGHVSADPLRVAVASNFGNTIQVIAAAFAARTDHRLTPVIGSTGKLYAQIVNGAPIDIFLAADAERPRRLEEQGLGVPGSRFTYATGQLVLWSPRPGYVDPEGRRLTDNAFRYLAIANPRLAPYGRAARQVLESRNLWKQLAGRIVTGENIGQAYQFVRSENADLGFIALSQIKRPGHTELSGSYWTVPASLHEAIEQQAILLKQTPAAIAFMEFLQGEQARDIITDHGYAMH
jgi:molybdate transport system substrate-binding protein